MAYTTINKPTDHFNTKLYTGNGGTQSITGINFKPDWTWIKQRSGTEHHILTDAVRGAPKNLYSNLNNAENNTATFLTSFNSDGFSLGSSSEVNGNSATYASWNWKANGQGSSNTDGSINTTYTSANTTAGFSIISYTGTGSNATVGHGLGSVPKIMFVKNRDGSNNWMVYSSALGATKYLKLNTTDAASTFSTRWNDTTPTSTVFTIGTDADVNGSGSKYIAYCFAEKTGYSKFGEYGGNQNANGSFIYTGMKPAFLMIKRYSTGNPATNWLIIDNKRNNTTNTGNLIAATLKPNLDSSQGGNNEVDFLSNGFKWRGTDSDSNHSGHNYIYMAFAEAPLVGTNNVPCTAR